jgi:membrane-bound lytic murein transglycosylase A
VDDPVDSMSVEIEGSGRVALDEGGEVWIHFAGKNGRRYRGTGGILRAMRKLVKSPGALKGKGREYRAYLDKAHTLYEKKDSIVFFELEPRKAAIGTQDVVLTPRRSLAVDRAVISLSTPVWVDTRAKSSAKGKTGPWRHLLIAQDTGGGILGTIRGDIYWGHDEEARAIGSRVNTKGRMWLLLPRSVSLPEPTEE